MDGTQCVICGVEQDHVCLCFDHTSDLPFFIHKGPHLVKEPRLIRFHPAEVSERARTGVQHMDIDLCAA